MAKATRLLHFHEEVEKDLVNYNKHGKDWSDIPTEISLQGTKGYSHNGSGEGTVHGKYYPDGHRPAGYGSGNGETQKTV